MGGFTRRALYGLICLFWLAVPGWAAEKFALVIGNSDYRNVSRLANPVRDATLISERLRSLGFTTTLRTDLDLVSFKSAVSSFAEDVEGAGPNAIAMLYYAGHGVQIDGENYLLPVDVEARKASTVILHSVSVVDMLRAFDEAQADANIIVLDACRDNPFKSTTRGFGRGLAQVSAPAGTIIAYATAPGQSALDGAGENSPYAKSLAEHITTPGISIEAVFKRVRISVNEETRGLQLPWEETSLTSDVVIAPERAKSQSATITEQDATGSEQRPADAKALAHLAYVRAVAANTIEAYDQFIQQYPHADEAPDALRNIEAISDERNWREAVEQNTIGAYVIYLNLHRGGNYAEEATTRISRLRVPTGQAFNTDEPEDSPSAVRKQASFVIRPGYDLFGNDFKVLKGSSFDQCLAACEQESSCVGFTFSRDKNWCFLKSEPGLLIKNSSADAAYLASVHDKIRTSTIAVHAKTDIAGNDYMNFEATDFAGCMTQCEADSRCRAFAFVRRNRWCWLKSAVGETSANRRVDSGIKD